MTIPTSFLAGFIGIGFVGALMVGEPAPSGVERVRYQGESIPQDQFWSMRSNELAITELDRIPRQSRLAIGGSPKREREASDCDGSYGGKSAVVLVNESALAYQKQWDDVGTTHDRLMEIGGFALAFLVAVLGYTFLVRR